MINLNATPEQLNEMCKNTMMEHLGITFTKVEGAHVTATMPVDHRHHQPYGIMHGGASVTLAETVGSVSAHIAAGQNAYTVGLEINANHIRSVRSGLVTGVSTPIHIGKSTQVWEVRITDEQDKLVCVSRITMAVLQKNE